MPCSYLSCICGKYRIPMRFLVAGLHGFMVVFSCYTMRVCLHIAITRMTPSKNKTKIDKSSCPMQNKTGKSSKNVVVFNWSQMEKEIVLASYYIGYAITHVPGGYFADKIGARRVLGVAIAASIIMTLATPITAKYTFIGLVMLRVIMGLVQGPLFPALSNILSLWLPKTELSTVGSFAYAGTTVGSLIGTAVSGATLKIFPAWSITFYFWAVINSVYLLFFLLRVFSTPTTHPFITPEEKEELEGKVTPPTKLMCPWKKVFTDMAVYACIVGQFGHDYIFFTLQTNLPNYMDQVLHFDVHENGVLSSIPYLMMFISSVGVGAVTDYILAKNWVRPITMRRFNTTLGSLPCGAFLLLTGYVGCNKYIIVVFFCLCLLCKGAFYPGCKVNCNEITKRYGGSLMGIVNGVGALSGIISPYVIGYLTADGTRNQWRLVFWIAFFIAVGTNVFYVLFCSSDRRSWDYLEGEEIPDKAK